MSRGKEIKFQNQGYDKSLNPSQSFIDPSNVQFKSKFGSQFEHPLSKQSLSPYALGTHHQNNGAAGPQTTAGMNYSSPANNGATTASGTSAFNGYGTGAPKSSTGPYNHQQQVNGGYNPQTQPVSNASWRHLMGSETQQSTGFVSS